MESSYIIMCLIWHNISEQYYYISLINVNRCSTRKCVSEMVNICVVHIIITYMLAEYVFQRLHNNMIYIIYFVIMVLCVQYYY